MQILGTYNNHTLDMHTEETANMLARRKDNQKTAGGNKVVKK